MATLLQKANLLRGLLTGEKAYTGPFYVTIDLTRRCNLKCLGCRYHSSLVNIPAPGDPAILDIPYHLVDTLCEELAAMGTKSITLMGDGEPMLYPRLTDLISKCKTLGFHVTLITNGTLLYEASIHSLINLQLDLLKVSLWATSMEEYEKNYPGTSPEYFKRVVNGLKLLSICKGEGKSKFPSVTLHQPINRHNFKKLDAMVDLAHQTGCNAISLSPFLTHRGELACYSLSPEEEQSLFLSLLRIKKRLKLLRMKNNIDETLLRYRIGEAVWNKFPCYIGWLHAHIKTDGSVLPCSPWNKPLGHLEGGRFQRIWNGYGYGAFRRQTHTREGLASITQECDCGFCCLLRDNRRVHKLFRFITPLLNRSKPEPDQGSRKRYDDGESF